MRTVLLASLLGLAACATTGPDGSPCTQKTLVDVQVDVWDFENACYRTVTEPRSCSAWHMDCTDNNALPEHVTRSLADGRCVINDGSCSDDYVEFNEDLLDCALVDGCCELQDGWNPESHPFLPCED